MCGRRRRARCACGSVSPGRGRAAFACNAQRARVVGGCGLARARRARSLQRPRPGAARKHAQRRGPHEAYCQTAGAKLPPMHRPRDKRESLQSASAGNKISATTNRTTSGQTMASELASKTCIPCRGGVPPLSMEAATRLLEQLDGWEIEQGRVTKSFTFKDFAAALAFVNRIGAISEEQDHPPDIYLTSGKV